MKTHPFLCENAVGSNHRSARHGRLRTFRSLKCAVACAAIVAAGAFAAQADTVVTNGDFETGVSAPWTSSGFGGIPAPASGAAHSGQYGLEATGGGPPALVSQEIQSRLVAGTVYHFTAWINLLEINPMATTVPRYNPHLGIYLGSGSFTGFTVVANATNTAGLGWQKLEVTRSFTAAELQDKVVLEVGGLIPRFQMDDVSGVSEILTNWSFDTAGGAGWSYAPLGTWAPFAVAGEAELHRPGTSFPTKILWQDLDISNVGGASGSASMQIKMGDGTSWPAPGTTSTIVYLDYLDGSGNPQRLLLFNPDNSTIAYGPNGSFFSKAFALPAGAQKVTGLSVDRTGPGKFQVIEFRLNLVQAAVVAPVVTITTPFESDSFAGGATIPLVAEVDASGGANVTGVEFYDNGTLIGQAQLSVLGRWVFSDTSELSVMGDPLMAIADYTPPSASGEQMYMLDGTFPSLTAFQGTFTHFNPSQITGNVGIQFTLSSSYTLDASISGDAPLGTRSLSGGINQHFPLFVLSWANAATGAHALTARASYGTTYAASAPVNITVTGAATTRVIGLSGSLAFGSVKVGASANATMTISNTGNSPLAVSSISYPSGFGGNWPSGTIAAGGSQNVTVTFSPAAAQAYSGTITVNSDATSGTNTIAPSGLGTQTPFEAWQAGKFTAGDVATGLTTPAADFDHDGMANLLEYAFGKNPKVADSPGIAVNVSGTHLQISFPCDASCTDVTYTVQASSTLAAGSWADIAASTGGATTLPISSLSTVSDTGTGLRTVTVTDSSALGSKRFLRVKVTSP